MSVSRLEYLFHAHLNGQCTAEERDELMHLLLQPENEAIFQTLISKSIENPDHEIQLDEKVAEEILQEILQHKKEDAEDSKIKNSFSVNWKRLIVAAAVIFLVGTSYWLLNSKTGFNNPNLSLTAKAPKILPGSNKALLTTADGSVIALDSAGTREITQQGNAAVKKTNGLLIYEHNRKSKSAGVYNTLSTPKGGQYQIKLPDGTLVWLNAASSIRYPTDFRGNYREVELTGEAYFEVAKNKEKPFRVKLHESQIEVLGTHFNVNAYADESNIKTSLLEGSIRLTQHHLSKVLTPGQEAILNSNSNELLIADADVQASIAWKNGLFQFDGADIGTIMHQIGRWYDVEIAFSGKIPNRKFTGKISRSAQLKDVLKILELSNVEFTVEGKKIIVKQPINQT